MRWSEWRAVADDPSKWMNRWERGLLKVEYLTDYMLRLWFEEELAVSIYELDFRPLLIEENPGVVFQLLRDKKRFRMVRADYALVWPNPETGEQDEHTIDLAPECVRFFCERYGKLRSHAVAPRSAGGEDDRP